MTVVEYFHPVDSLVFRRVNRNNQLELAIISDLYSHARSLLAISRFARRPRTIVSPLTSLRSMSSPHQISLSMATTPAIRQRRIFTLRKLMSLLLMYNNATMRYQVRDYGVFQSLVMARYPDPQMPPERLQWFYDWLSYGFDRRWSIEQINDSMISYRSINSGYRDCVTINCSTANMFPMQTYLQHLQSLCHLLNRQAICGCRSQFRI